MLNILINIKDKQYLNLILPATYEIKYNKNIYLPEAT